MNEQDLGHKIVLQLNQGLDHLESSTLNKLQQARKAALDHYRDQPEQALGLAWLGSLALRGGTSCSFNYRNPLLIGLVLLSLAAVAFWQVSVQGNDFAEIDAGLLSGELPIDAYLDNNFEAWLKRSLQ